MTTKYRHLTNIELIRLVEHKNGDLVDELCQRLRTRLTVFDGVETDPNQMRFPFMSEEYNHA